MPRFQRRQGISPIEQAVRVSTRFPQFQAERFRPDLVLVGWLQPRPLSGRYRIRIVKSPQRAPRVFVLDPPLPPGVPHVYREGHLCLYWPKEWTWRDDVDMATTILPWTATWLLYYELWTETGSWLGPSSQHGTPQAKSA
jgi:hypothetical protein